MLTRRIADAIASIRGPRATAAFARSAGGAFVANAAGVALGVVTQACLARILGVATFGTYVYVITWVNVLIIPALLGLDTASVRFVSVYYSQGNKQMLREFVVFSVCRTMVLSGGLSLGLIAAVAVLRDRLHPATYAAFQVGCLLLPASALLQLGVSYLQATKKIIHAQLIDNVPRNLIVLALVVFVLLPLKVGLDAVHLVGVTAFATGVTLLVVYYLLPFASVHADQRTNVPSPKREWTRVSFALFLISGSQAILARTDVLLIGIFLNVSDAGVYAVASRLATLVGFGITAINASLAPTIADLYAQKAHVELQRIVTFASRLVMLYAVPVMVVLWVGGRFLLGLFGAEFQRGYSVLLLLSAGQIVVALAGSVGFLLTMTGHHQLALRVIGATAVVNLGLNLLMIPKWGMQGAALATMLATACRSLTLTYFVQTRVGITATGLRLPGRKATPSLS
jgi:O-antigen/teichoic acid export membrane protein